MQRFFHLKLSFDFTIESNLVIVKFGIKVNLFTIFHSIHQSALARVQLVNIHYKPAYNSFNSYI